MIDLFAEEMVLAAMKAEAQELGMSRALLAVFDDMRTKVMPNLLKLREQKR